MTGQICRGLIAIVLGATVTAEAATLGFIDDFSGADTNGWGGGVTTTNPGTGGADGLGDGFLQLSVEESGNFGAFSNNLNYQGDWSAAGITGVTFRLNDVGADESFEFHLLLSDQLGGGGTTYQHNTGFDPPNGAWQQVSLSLSDPTQWTRIRGSASFEDVLGDVAAVHFRHDLVPHTASPDGIVGDLGIDDVSLVPEPATWAVLAFGLAAFSRRAPRRDR